MKKIFFGVVAVFILGACGGSGSDQKAQIIQLSTDWASAKSEASGLTQALANSISLLSSASATLDSIASAGGTPTDEMRKNIGSMRLRMDTANSDMIALVQEISLVAAPLENNKGKMKALEDFANFDNKFEGNAEESIAALSKIVAEANAKWGSFKERLDKAQSEVDAIYDEVKALGGGGSN